jgi:hypothetical protein
MRKFRLLSILLLAIVFVFVNCTKEGPEGPVGGTGAQGPTGASGAPGTPGAVGPQGPAGSANVIYSAWLTVANSSPVIDSPFTDYGTCKRWYRPAPSLTQNIIDQGLVLSYWKVTSVIYSTIPYLFPVGAKTYFLGSIPTLLNGGKIIYFTSIFGDGVGWTPNGGAETRYIIIPGVIGGGRIMSGAATGYTPEQLKAMSYEEIIRLFNIPA